MNYNLIIIYMYFGYVKKCYYKQFKTEGLKIKLSIHLILTASELR